MKLAAYLLFVVSCATACGSSSPPVATSQAGAGGGAGAGAGGLAGDSAGGGLDGGSAAGSSASGSAGSMNSGVTVLEAGTLEMVSPGAHPLLHFGLNDECLGAVVPVSGGNAACRVILTGVTGGCTVAGLSTPSTADQSAVLAEAHATGQTSVEQSVCEVNQVAAHSGSACAASSMSGWCYVDGGCAQTATSDCANTLCATPAYTALKLAYQLPAWIVCD